jgi:hypothetical protein
MLPSEFTSDTPRKGLSRFIQVHTGSYNNSRRRFYVPLTTFQVTNEVTFRLLRDQVDFINRINRNLFFRLPISIVLMIFAYIC